MAESETKARTGNLAKVRSSCEKEFPKLGQGTKMTKLALVELLPLTRPTLDEPEYWTVVSEVANRYGIILPRKRVKGKKSKNAKKIDYEKLLENQIRCEEENIRLKKALKRATDLLFGHSIDITSMIEEED